MNTNSNIENKTITARKLKKQFIVTFNSVKMYYFLQEYLTSRYAWLNLSTQKFDVFLDLIFPELKERGFPIGDDEYKVVRMFAISNVNILQFGQFLICNVNFNLHLAANFSKLVY